MNVFTFTGNLGRDSETRYLQSGSAVVSFPVPVSSGFGDNKNTTWVQCSIFGKRGESLAPYLKKGSQVCITGELHNRKYTSKEGQEKYSLEVNVREITLVGGKVNSGNESSPQSNSYGNSPQSPSSHGASTDFEDDVPW